MTTDEARTAVLNLLVAISELLGPARMSFALRLGFAEPMCPETVRRLNEVLEVLAEHVGHEGGVEVSPELDEVLCRGGLHS